MKTSENNTLVTFGKSIQRPEALETMPANLMAMMQNGQWRKPIEAIRKEKNPKLQKEMKQRLLQKDPDQEMTHSRLLNKSRMTSREFRNCVQSLIERQAILCHEDEIGYHNRVGMKYTLNPVLEDVEIS